MTFPFFSLPAATPTLPLRRMFIKDLEISCLIGVLAREKTMPQRVRLNLDLGVCDSPAANSDDCKQVVCYRRLTDDVRAVVVSGHVNLVETLAERVAAECLCDARVRVARVRVEKLDAITDAAAVGVEIERFNALSL